MTKTKNLVYSAVQPTGGLHLGNYLGALKNFVALQEQHQCIFCVADLHALTLWDGFDELAQQTKFTAAVFLACGLDPKKSIIFNQSRVAAHAELAWVLTCVARFGWLNLQTQFKQKSATQRDATSAGLFAYPALMAADILAYRATHVPIGEDQKQHLELARNIAHKFNKDLSHRGGEDFFPLPEPIIPKETARVMSLRDGTKKMSKSDISSQTRIELTDDKDAIAQKIKKAKTDPHPLPHSEKELGARPEAANLVGLVAALSDQTISQTLKKLGGASFKQLKDELTELLIAEIAPISEKIKIYQHDDKAIALMLDEGAQAARAIAEDNMAQIRKLIGLF